MVLIHMQNLEHIILFKFNDIFYVRKIFHTLLLVKNTSPKQTHLSNWSVKLSTYASCICLFESQKAFTPSFYCCRQVEKLCLAEKFVCCALALSPIRKVWGMKRGRTEYCSKVVDIKSNSSKYYALSNYEKTQYNLTIQGKNYITLSETAWL